MSTRDIQGHVRELYGIEVSPDLVSAVTDSVIEEMQFSSWKERKAIGAALKSTYLADNAELAARELEAFDQGEWARVPAHRLARCQRAARYPVR